MSLKNDSKVPSTHGWGWYLVFITVSILLLPRLFAWGMFLDGVNYAAVSRNMAMGQGFWWEPFYTETIYPQFHEQPPLALALQSFFFRVLGDHYLVEKGYCLLIMLLTAALLTSSWKGLTRFIGREDLKPFVWLPLLFWVIIPKWSWGYRNNLLELTMALFCLLAFWLMIQGFERKNPLHQGMMFFGAGVAIVLAILSKGPTGMFPLITPLLFAGFLPSVSLRKGLVANAWVAFGFVATASLLALSPPLRYSVVSYLHHQLQPALSGDRSTHGARWDVLIALAENLSILAVITGVYWFRNRTSSVPQENRVLLMTGLACITLGLCGTLPMAVSHKFRSFYLLPSFPYFAMGFAFVVRSFFAPLPISPPPAWRWTPQRIGATALLAGVLLWSIFQIGTPRKHEREFTELGHLSQELPEGITIGGHPSLAQDWMAHALLQRYLRISLDTGPTAKERTFLLLPEDTRAPGFAPTGLQFRKMFLHKWDEE